MKKSVSTILVLGVALFSLSTAEARTTANCARPEGKMDELICENPELAALNNKVNALFEKVRRARQNEDEDGDIAAQKVTAEQEKWINNIREECILLDTNIYNKTTRTNQAACLKFEFEKRLSMLDRPDLSLPLTDSKVSRMISFLSNKNCGDVYEIGMVENKEALQEFSCRYFAKSPKKAYELFGNCFGVGKDSFTPICDPADRIKQIPGLYDYIEQLRHMQGNRGCQGASKYMNDRAEKLSQMQMLNDGDVNFAKAKWFNEFEESNVFDPQRPQLAHWSRQGIWEREQYEKLKDLRAQAEDGLKEYYARYRSWGPQKSLAVARYYTITLAASYLGTTDSSSVEKYPTRSLDLNDLNAYLEGKNNVIAKNKSDLGYLLRLAVVNDYSVKDIAKILDDGAPVEGGYKKNIDTPLMQAVKRLDVTELLIRRGADINAQNEFGKTALMYAVQYGSRDIVSLLILHGADVNLMTFGKEECGKKLLVLDAGGRTALMYAAWYATPDVIQALISHGANIHYRDSEGEKSYDYLAKNKNMTSDEMEQAQQLLGK